MGHVLGAARGLGVDTRFRGSRAWGLGFECLGFRVKGSRVQVQCLRVWGLGLGV